MSQSTVRTNFRSILLRRYEGNLVSLEYFLLAKTCKDSWYCSQDIRSKANYFNFFKNPCFLSQCEF